MKVLITGVNGQLGWEVARRLTQLKVEHLGVDVDTLDITDADAVVSCVCDYHPDVIVHCAAYTDVDKAETEPEVCCRVNGMGTLNMVRAALRINAKLLYVSTDYVFDGSGDAPYPVDAARRPLNIYGQSKLQGEEVIQSLMTRYFIVRSSWIYGVHGENYMKTTLLQAGDHREPAYAADQVGAPTYAPDLARLICEMIRTNRYGVYHAAAEGVTSRADAAQYLLTLAGKRSRVKAAPTVNYPGKAHRPLNSRLSMASLDAAGFSRLPDWKNSLANYLNELNA